MVEGRELTLASLSMDELAGVLNRYPWYGGAHMELCRRMVRSGGGSWGVAQYAGEALHIVSRRAVADLVRRSRDEDWSDLDVEKILKSYISAPAAAPQPSPVYERKVSRGPVPGDYFSQEAYAEVSREEDNALAKAVSAVKSEPEVRERPAALAGDVFCTETLAGIYASQGYFKEAKRIYSKLLLAFPEKNVYFASLIEKMDQLLKN